MDRQRPQSGPVPGPLPLAPFSRLPLEESRRLGVFAFALLLGLILVTWIGYRWLSRPGPLAWSRESPVRLVSGPSSGFRVASDPDKPKGDLNPVRTEATGKSGKGKKSDLPASFRVNPNTASEEELCVLPGIGPVLAKRIIAARMNKGFGKPEDLRRVSGIGPKTLEKLRPHLEFVESAPGQNQTQAKSNAGR